MTIKYLLSPHLRVDIKGAFENLADRDWQMQEWVEKRTPNQYFNGLTYYVVDTLYNLCDLDEYRESNIGQTLYDEEEAQQIQKFCKWFIDLLNSIELYSTTNKANSDYLDHPEWPKVYIGAKEIYELMDKNDKKYNFWKMANE